MQIFVRTFTEKTIIIEAEPCCSIGHLKELIREKFTCYQRMRLIFGGRSLEEAKTLACYKIQKNSTIHLALSLHDLGVLPRFAHLVNIEKVEPYYEDKALGDILDYRRKKRFVIRRSQMMSI